MGLQWTQILMEAGIETFADLYEFRQKENNFVALGLNQGLSKGDGIKAYLHSQSIQRPAEENKIIEASTTASVLVNDSHIPTSKWADQLQIARKLKEKAADQAWILVTKMGNASKLFNRVQSGDLTEERAKARIHAGLDGGRINAHVGRLNTLYSQVKSKHAINVFNSGPQGGLNVEKVEQFFEEIYADLQEANLSRDDSNKKGKTVLNSYRQALAWASKKLQLQGDPNEVADATSLASEAHKEFYRPPNPAKEFDVTDLIILEKGAFGELDGETKLDQFFCICTLLLVYSTRRFANLQHMKSSEYRKVAQGSMGNSYKDKNYSSLQKWFQIADSDFVYKKWYTLLLDLYPEGDRNFTIPAPIWRKNRVANRMQPVDWKSTPLDSNAANRWLEKIFLLGGMPPEMAKQKSRIHGCKRTLPKMMADANNKGKLPGGE